MVTFMRAGRCGVLLSFALCHPLPLAAQTDLVASQEALFDPDHAAENFRNMDRIFPSVPVAASEEPWAFARDEAPLPDTYAFAGEAHSVEAFLLDTATTGLLVIRGDTITHESYGSGAGEEARFTSWSVAKSVLSALIGIAHAEGSIRDLRDPIGAYVPELDGTPYGAVPIEDALTMSSGIAFDETYDDPDSDINMLFARAFMGERIVDILGALPAARPPGEVNAYISSDSMALGLVLEAATGMPIADYLEDRLWRPMGAEASAYWNTDPAGLAFALCCLNATLRDWGRFGRLYLEGGARDDRQIVPADWIAASVAPEAPHLQPRDGGLGAAEFGYGYKWWLPAEPAGAFVAMGIWGQYVYVDPARDVVIVKTSADPEAGLRHHETVAFFRAVAASLAEGH